MESNQPGHDVPTEPVADSIQLHEKISSFIRRFQQNAGSESELNWGIYDIANQAFDAMQSTIARQKLAAYPPDYTIEIARNACGTLEFDRADEMIGLGYRKTRENLSSLSKVIKW